MIISYISMETFLILNHIICNQSMKKHLSYKSIYFTHTIDVTITNSMESRVLVLRKISSESLDLFAL